AINLQPVVGSRLTGFALRFDPSIGIHDPLMARLLLLDDGRTPLVWVSCDLIGLDPADDAQLRQQIAGRVSIPVENVLVSCTHTHGGPCSMPFRGVLRQIEREWLDRTFAAIADAAATLPQRLRRAQLAHGQTTVTGIGHNRQDPTCPIDERLIVAQVRDADDPTKVIATILNYATHPVVLGPNNLLFTADYAGYAARFVEQSAGGVALFVQGSAGDVNPLVCRDNPRDACTFEMAEAMGRTLAGAVGRALQSAAWQDLVSIRLTGQPVELPLDAPPDKDEIERIRADLLARRGPRDTIPITPEARWAAFELDWLEELQQAVARDAVPRRLVVNLHAARIGDLLVVSFPLEIYSQIGLDVREQLAPRRVVIAGYTNGLFGYAATDRAIAQGGYGPAQSYRFFPRLLTPITRGAQAILVRAACQMLERVRGDDV
ncbi:MAG TPA: neutral/alkaline non-lysosomal ceramidase N-terminal domain-containing protein, partial [Tepidisphaeraceae bacterium]|nr:neutral/alkaline non-lysosomal ceramidase N-terminal domain-containing protein [Tepidisphaeraceae bacterium]